MSNFEINEHGVITNPERIQIIDKCFIKIGQCSNGFWWFGHDLRLGDYGSCSPVMPQHGFGSEHMERVVKYAALALKKRYEKTSYLGMKQMIQALEKMVYGEKQLTLF